MAMTIAKLTQAAQNQVNSLAIENDCNAVLSMQFSVAMTNTPGGSACKVAVSCFGTPCVILPTTTSSTRSSSMTSTEPSPMTTKETLFAGGTSTDDRTVYSLNTEAPAGMGLVRSGSDPSGLVATGDDMAPLPNHIDGSSQRQISMLQLVDLSPTLERPDSEVEDEVLPDDLYWSSPVHDRARMTIQAGHIPQVPI